MSDRNPKRENLLNLALDATERELERSPDLQAGYDRAEDTWELVVRHSAGLEGLRAEYPQLSVVELLNGYAVVTLPRELMADFTQRVEIEYIEKPKRLFFAVEQGVRASCISAAQGNPYGLSGKGVICGLADSGIDWRHPDFCNPDGTSRILAIWDQTLEPDPEAGLAPPEGYDRGVEFTQEQLNLALKGDAENSAAGIRTADSSGHGTHVAGIMAGNGRASGGRYRGVAYESGLLVVKLGTPRENGFPSTVELMMAVDYLVRTARRLGLPIAVNLSFGNNYGSHSGTSLIETYLDSLSGYWKNVIVAGSGNEGAGSVHTSGVVRADADDANKVQLAVAPYETSLSIQIWKSYTDVFDVQLVSPSGATAGIIRPVLGPQRFTLGRTEILLYYGEPSPYSVYQEIYIELLPARDYIDSGVWELLLFPERIVQGDYDMWLPGAGSLNIGTGFLYPTERTTITIPATAEKVVSVAAYDSRSGQLADFSGRGYTRQNHLVKPDLAAPGVGIVSAAPNGGYTAKSGTSMAAPFVTGSAALLMEWGIVQGNDVYLYGEKVRAYLQRGAKPLQGISEYPNPLVGWGVLCLRDSLNIFG